MTDTIERGRITFLYEPAEGEDHADKLVDVYHFYALMRPEGGDTVRRLVVGQKKLPEQEDAGTEGRYWGFVDAVAEDVHAFDAWREEGEGTPPEEPPHAVGKGTYALVRDGDDTRLAYKLGKGAAEESDRKGVFNLDDEGVFVLSVKNPEAGSPAGAGLEPDRRAEYPRELAEKFGDRRWIAADPPAFLDHEGAEFLLIATGETPADEGADVPEPGA